MVAVLLGLLSSAARAQQTEEFPKADIFVGWQYMEPGGHVKGVSLNSTAAGWGTGVTYNFTKNFGLTVDTGSNYASNNHITTVMFGPKFTYRGERFQPFVNFLVGLHRLAPQGPVFALPADNNFGLIAGGGLDIKLSPHVALRAFEADFVRGNHDTGTLVPVDGLTGARIRSGFVFLLGGEKPAPTTATCSVSPTEVFAGEPVQATASTSGFNPKHTLAYNWTSTGGAITGKDASASVDTKGLNPGSYTVNVHVTDPKSSKAMADCNSTFAIKEMPKHPPQISCSANPPTVQSGTPSTVTCSCSTPDTGAEYQPAVTTSIGGWSASAGKVSGSDTAATLDTAGVGAGPVTVSATCTDNRGLSSPGSATVNVEVPPPAPMASKLNDCEFKPNAKPARVDNECKAKLDDYALALQRDAEAKGVIVGSYDEKEGKNAKAARTLAAQRAANTKEYLVKEKGIDPGRLETRVDGASGRMVENWIVPAGATFTGEGTEVVTQKATAGAYGTGKKKAAPKQ
jgi:hypothetical protein